MFNETELEIIKDIIFFDEKFIFPKKDLSFYKKMYNLNLSQKQFDIINFLVNKINLFFKENPISSKKEFKEIFDLFYDDLDKNNLNFNINNPLEIA